MATTSSPSREAPRQSARRRATIEEALDHAEAILAESGAGAVTVTEIARRLGMRGPSLYKYFPSLHAVYDALFERGNAKLAVFVDESLAGIEPGLDRALEGMRTVARWSTISPGLAPLMFWRPVPGFVPSDESYAPSVALWASFRADLGAAARNGELSAAADSEEAMRLLTSVVGGVVSQQMTNQPGVSFEDGLFTSLTDLVLDMFVEHYAPRRGKP